MPQITARCRRLAGEDCDFSDVLVAGDVIDEVMVDEYRVDAEDRVGG